MRLDHLLSREIRYRIKASLKNRFQKIQHPAPGAPAPRHLDSRIAKHGIQKIRGAGHLPGPRERITKSIHIKLIRILHDRRSFKIYSMWFTLHMTGNTSGRRYEGREADALAREVDEGRGKLR